MSETNSNEAPAQAPASTSETPVAIAASPKRSTVRTARPMGTGVMGSRVRDDEPAPPREVVDEAKTAARTSGHRFDLMRYLRLRRKH